MTWIDVTVPVRSGMVVYEGDPEVRIGRVADMAEGAVCNVSRAELGLHSGTHIDAPVHFLPGAGGIEAIPVEALMGPVFVVDAQEVCDHIDRRTLDQLEVPAGMERVLFKTANSRLWESGRFERAYVALIEDAARELAGRGVRLVGIDYLSVAPYGDPAPTHLALLEAGVVVLEGLDLRAVEPGRWEMISLPLLVPGSDGAPSRTLLRRP